MNLGINRVEKNPFSEFKKLKSCDLTLNARQLVLGLDHLGHHILQRLVQIQE